jgi:hypothetical protein
MYRLEATLPERRRVPMFDQHDNPLPGRRAFITKLKIGEPEFASEIAFPLDFDFGDSISLIGDNLEDAVIAPGQTLTFSLYWQARKSMAASYTVFTHLVDETGRIVGQRDTIPEAGRNPTNEWVPGEIIVERYEIPISPNAKPGQHTLRVGMYDATTGERLPVRDAVGAPFSGDYIPLHSVDVRGG